MLLYLLLLLLLLLSHFRVSDSVQHYRRKPTRLPYPWNSPGKNTGVGCHFLLQGMKVKSESEVALSCPTVSDSMDCSPPGSSVHGIFQGRVLEWDAIAFSVFTSRLFNCSYVTRWASLVAQMVKHLPAMQETQLQSLGGEDPLEKEMATDFSVLAWEIHGQRSLVGHSSCGH